jgi:hypothetical protein
MKPKYKIFSREQKKMEYFSILPENATRVRQGVRKHLVKNNILIVKTTFWANNVDRTTCDSQLHLVGPQPTRVESPRRNVDW